MTNVTNNQASCGTKSAGLSCGRPPAFSPCSAAAASATTKAETAAIINSSSRRCACSGLGEQDHQRDQQTEEARCFAESEADQQVGELARSSRRVAQGARQVVGEDVADADAGADEGEASEASADELCCLRIHSGRLHTGFWF